MRNRLPIRALAFLLVGGAGAAQADHPVFQVEGFPVTQHQLVAVQRSADVHERTAPSLAMGGMPGSPHQLTVMTPRPGVTQQQLAQKLRDDGFSRIRFVIPSRYTVLGLRDGQWTTLTVDSRTGEPR